MIDIVALVESKRQRLRVVLGEAAVLERELNAIHCILQQPIPQWDRERVAAADGRGRRHATIAIAEKTPRRMLKHYAVVAKALLSGPLLGPEAVDLDTLAERCEDIPGISKRRVQLVLADMARRGVVIGHAQHGGIRYRRRTRMSA